ncbi:unnamed protein product, partial [Rotaria socialis]
MKWAANYIEEQQTQLILSLFDDNAGKPVVNNDDDNEEQDEEDDFKSFRPSLQTMGI